MDEALRVCADGMLAYRRQALSSIARSEFIAGPLLQVLPELKARFRIQAAAIDTNDAFLKAVLSVAGLLNARSNDNPAYDEDEDVSGLISPLLIQIHREWSQEGQVERDQCFGKCIAALTKYLPPAGQRVLVPGAGLGRLNWDLCTLGYNVLGIERAISMLLTARFFLLHCLPNDRTIAISPFAFEIGRGPSNARAGEHLSRTVTVPDAASLALAKEQCAAPKGGERIIAGDFTEFCKLPCEAQQWDAVISCFYIDASGDVITATQATHAVLKPGGLWICCGPLEYDGGGGFHADDQALRLCADELLLFVQRCGFEIVESAFTPCDYTANPHSMIHTGFEALFFVARKTAATAGGGVVASACAPSAAAIS